MKILSISPIGSSLFVYALNDEGGLFWCDANVIDPAWKPIPYPQNLPRGAGVGGNGYHITMEQHAAITRTLSDIHENLVAGWFNHAINKLEELMQRMDDYEN